MPFNGLLKAELNGKPSTMRLLFFLSGPLLHS